MTDPEVSLLQDIISELRKGYDVRPLLGIKGRAGRRPKNGLRNTCLSAHYLVLRRRGQNAKAAENCIQKHWLVKPPMTKKIVNQYRSQADLYIHEYGHDDDLEHWEQRAKFWSGRIDP